jgi:DnaJ family protein C protein 28
MSNPYKKISDADEIARRRQDGRLDDLRSLIDRIVDDAQAKGMFDDLPGAGKPLDLEEPDPYSYDQRLAYKLLKDNDFTLPWIHDRNETMARIAQFRDALRAVWQEYRQHYTVAPSDTHRTALRLDWHKQCDRLQLRLAALNRRIDRTNLHIPVTSLEIIKLNLDSELHRIGAGRELA